MGADESRILRERQADAIAELDRQDRPDPSPGATILIQTVGSIAGGSFGACTEVDPGGVEMEGGDASLTPLGDPFYALNVGIAAPPGMYVADAINGRWVFAYYG